MAAVTSSAVTAAAMAAVASTSSAAATSAIQTKASSLSKCSSSLVPLSSLSSSSKLGVSSFTPSLGSRSGQVMTRGSRRLALVSTRAASKVDVAGGEKMREGAKAPSKESLLTPRFYTTDFDEMEALLDPVNNPNYREEEFLALLNEFKTDYNQTHFVRNKEFKEAADNLQGTTREIFLEFLERSCTAEFSGFLLYKELGRRLKKKNPVVAEIFTLMSRDEARHAGFLNKAMSDFNLALDLGFLTKMRKYTFFKPKFIFYATYLSEKIGYWRYITINRHLQNKPEHIIFPIFKYFFNWCQDENRHGDFFTALLKNQPKFVDDWESKLWSRFFCLSVYVTMYLNDHQRSAFYESLGMNTTDFNMHVIKETNKTTARIFPAVPDVESPEFKVRMDRLVDLNKQLSSIGATDGPAALKNLQKLPIIAGMLWEMLVIFNMKPVECGSMDFYESEPQVVY